jgi:hypothetical protein
MPPTPSRQRPLVDDAQFFAELERFAHIAERSSDSRIDVHTTPYADAFAALESGLPVNSGAAIAAPHHERPPIDAPQTPTVQSAAPETRVTVTMAAVVLAACLTAGAAAAAYVFHDRLEQITAPRMATR